MHTHLGKANYNRFLSLSNNDKIVSMISGLNSSELTDENYSLYLVSLPHWVVYGDTCSNPIPNWFSPSTPPPYPRFIPRKSFFFPF